MKLKGLFRRFTRGKVERRAVLTHLNQETGWKPVPVALPQVESYLKSLPKDLQEKLKHLEIDEFNPGYHDKISAAVFDLYRSAVDGQVLTQKSTVHAIKLVEATRLARLREELTLLEEEQEALQERLEKARAAMRKECE